MTGIHRQTDVACFRVNFDRRAVSWKKLKESLVENMSTTHLSCFSVLLARNTDGIEAPRARMFFDNLDETYGLFAKQIRQEICNEYKKSNLISSVIFRESEPNIFSFKKNKSTDGIDSDIFGVAEKYGFGKFRYIITCPYYVKNIRHLFIGYSSFDFLKQDVEKILEKLDVWLEKMRRSTRVNNVIARHEETNGVSDVALEGKELECLRWLAAGKTMQDVSTITGLSYKSVRYHLEKAKIKYGFATAQQTLVQATIDYKLNPFGEYNNV